MFLREAEFRLSVSKMSFDNKWKEFINILNYAEKVGINNLYSLEYLSESTEKLNEFNFINVINKDKFYY